MQYSTTLAVGAVSLLLFMGCTPNSTKEKLPVGMESMEMRLNRMVEGKADTADLRIVYDDVHGLFGGVRTTVHGDGRVEQVVIAPVEQHPAVHDISKEQIRSLAKLLVSLRAWEQETPNREPNEDESRTTLSIYLGAMESHVWEWHNDVAANNRIGTVLQSVREFAWR